MIPLRFSNPIFIQMELIYTLLIIFFCILIYFKTKEIYDLSKHKGIFYFRTTFLFLATSYFIRFIMIILKLNLSRPMNTSSYFFLFGILITYTSTLAIISLFLSNCWKKFKSKYIYYYANLVALLISIISYVLHEPQIMVLIQLILFITTISLAIKTHNNKKNKHFSNLIIIYILLFLFWFIGMMPLGMKLQIPFEYIIPTQILSILIFIIIYFKVRKKIK